VWEAPGSTAWVNDVSSHDLSRLTSAIKDRQLSVALAESMTGGALGEALVSLPGSGDWLAGGVIAYMSRVKRDLLGVSDGPVIAESAAMEMAVGVARTLSTEVGISTTGVAGPATMEQEPVGSTWIAVAVDGNARARHYQFVGTPTAIRRQAVAAAIRFAAAVVGARSTTRA
jgi:nicotinamide-nucleotide amidase